MGQKVAEVNKINFQTWKEKKLYNLVKPKVQQ